MENKEASKIVFQTQKVTKEIHSADKSKILILSYLENMETRIDFTYKVISAKTKKELISGKFTGIKMDWFTNNSLKGYLYQGIIEKENPKQSFEIINLK
jgi:hypothetical protein